MFVFTSKSSFQDFLTFKNLSEADKSDANKLAEVYNEFNAGLKAEIEKAEANKASKEEIEAAKSELKASFDSQFMALKTILAEQGKFLSKITRESEGVEVDSIAKSLAENKEKLVALKNGNSSNNVKIQLKAVGDMTYAGNTTGQVAVAYRKPGIGDVPERRMRLLDLVTVGSISSPLKEWVYVANEEGAAGSTAEGTLKNQIDFELLVGSQKVEKITAFITITDEMLEDVDQLQSLINTKLATKLNLNLETQVFGGSGVSPLLNGIKTVATTFAAGTFASTIDQPNEVDVLAVAANQIEIANQPMPTAIMMHPSDVTSILVTKVTSTDRRYVDRLQMVAGSLSFDGIPLIKTTLVTQGEFLIGDFTKAYLDYKKGVTIEIGYNADNFVKNFKTIRAELRAVVSVEHNDRTAFVKGVFATAKAALETT